VQGGGVHSRQDLLEGSKGAGDWSSPVAIVVRSVLPLLLRVQEGWGWEIYRR